MSKVKAILMKKKILITGGAGFIGSHLIPLLSNYDLYIVDSLLPQVHGENADFKKIQNYPFVQECIKANINEFHTYSHLLSQVDIIIHLAAYTGTGQSMYQLAAYFENNVTGTAQLLQAIAEHGKKVEKIILSSSRAVYGEGAYISKKYNRVSPPTRKKENLEKGKFSPVYLEDEELSIAATKESDPLQPVSVYGMTKLLQEQLVNNYCFQNTQTNAIVFRFQNVYGPGQSLANPYTGVLGIFSNLMRKNLPIEIYEEGKIARDFVFVGDVVSTIVESIHNEAFDGKTINLGSGELSKLTDVAYLMKSKIGSDSSIQLTTQFRLGDIAGNYADNSLLKSIYPFEPTSLSIGMKKYTDWILQQPIDNNSIDVFRDSIGVLKENGLMGSAIVKDHP